DLPLNSRAGWGYLLLTNFLPGLGTGSYTFHAYASDANGHVTDLGTKTITCNNAAAATPFGAIDTPGQGETLGNSYIHSGSVLSPTPDLADRPDGGTVRVMIDGRDVGAPFGWTSRPDLTALFPVAQYPGISHAAGAFIFDSTTLTNGLHTISWVVTAAGGGTS